MCAVDVSKSLERTVLTIDISDALKRTVLTIDIEKAIVTSKSTSKPVSEVRFLDICLFLS